MKNPDKDRWYIYMLQCGDGSLYTGITKDIDKRVEKHNSGTGSRCTRARRPVELVYTEDALNRSEALKREAAIKKLAREKKLQLIQNKA